jgi:hypothetical protein
MVPDINTKIFTTTIVTIVKCSGKIVSCKAYLRLER